MTEPYVALGNSEPIPQWMVDRADLAELLEVIRSSRRESGWCDHGLRLRGAPVLARGRETATCGVCG